LKKATANEKSKPPEFDRLFARSGQVVMALDHTRDFFADGGNPRDGLRISAPRRSSLMLGSLRICTARIA
jgi:hypothetical protein